MIEERLTVGLVIERRELSAPWGGFAWRPVSIFPTPPDVEPWTSLGTFGQAQRYYAGAYDIMLYSTDTANYRDNLDSAEAKLWVVLRPEGREPPVEVVTVTADPAEGEANTEAGSNVVETVSMPADVAGFIAQFIADHHIERPVYKRQRDRKHGRAGQGDRPQGSAEPRPGRDEDQS